MSDESKADIMSYVSDQLLKLREELEQPRLDERMTQFLRGQIMAYADIEDFLLDGGE